MTDTDALLARADARVDKLDLSRDWSPDHALISDLADALRAEREAKQYERDAANVSADRAERAERESDAARAECEQWSKWPIAEIAARNPSVMEYMRHWEDRAERAEAECERLRALLREAREQWGACTCESCQGIREVAVQENLDLTIRIDAALAEGRK